MDLTASERFVGVGFEWAGDFVTPSRTLWTFFIVPMLGFVVGFLYPEGGEGNGPGEFDGAVFDIESGFNVHNR